jgi:hypothetical protein
MTWGDVLHNWLFASLGNAAGAVVFVAASSGERERTPEFVR